MSTAQSDDGYSQPTGSTGSVLETVLEQGVASESLLQMKMEHQSIMAECRVRQRDFTKIIAELESRFKACPEFARAAIYSKPIGTVFEITCDCGAKYEVGVNYHNYAKSPRHEECEKCGKWAPKAQRETKKKARNLSIRAAEELAEIYGFNRLHCGISKVDATTVKITASFFDYQKLRTMVMESLVSKTGTSKDKKVYVIPDDRFYGLVIKAEASKVIREVVLRSMPASLKTRAFAMAEKIASEGLTDAEIDKIVSAFASKGVDLKRLEVYVGTARKDGWNKSHRMELVEAWNSLVQNEATVAEIFGEDEANQKPATPSADDMLPAAGVKTPSPAEPEHAKPVVPAKPEPQPAAESDSLAAEHAEIEAREAEDHFRERILEQSDKAGVEAVLQEAYTKVAQDVFNRLVAVGDEHLKKAKRGPRSNGGQKQRDMIHE